MSNFSVVAGSAGSVKDAGDRPLVEQLQSALDQCRDVECRAALRIGRTQRRQVADRVVDVERAVLDPALARQRVRAVQDHRLQHAREVAHHVLAELGPIGRAVVDDARVAERRARRIQVGGDDDAVVGGQIDALATQGADAALDHLALERLGLRLPQAAAVAGPAQLRQLIAIEHRLGVPRAALVEDDDVALIEDRPQELRAEKAQGRRVDQAAARTAGQHEQRRGLGPRRRRGLAVSCAEAHETQLDRRPVRHVRVLRHDDVATVDPGIDGHVGRRCHEARHHRLDACGSRGHAQRHGHRQGEQALRGDADGSRQARHRPRAPRAGSAGSPRFAFLRGCHAIKPVCADAGDGRPSRGSAG